jgi:HAD superfamily hydrolase (TIGR01490 family)
MALALFDFDGTITKKDSLLEFIRYSVGERRYYAVMARFTPAIVYHKYVTGNGGIAKEQVMRHLFAGYTEKDLRLLGRQFAKEILPDLIVENARERIHWHQAEGHRVVVISASLDVYLSPWAEAQELELICTEMAFVNNKATGGFSTPNCNGDEKVHRLRAMLSTDDYPDIYAYGNSKGDRPMLSLAHHPYFCHFH